MLTLQVMENARSSDDSNSIQMQSYHGGGNVVKENVTVHHSYLDFVSLYLFYPVIFPVTFSAERSALLSAVAARRCAALRRVGNS